MHLSRYKFGDPVAENDTEILRNADMFMTTLSWRAAQDEQTNLILGRKGAGKTALRLGLQYHVKTRRWATEEILFKTSIAERFKQSIEQACEHPDFVQSTFFVQMWKYAIVTAAANALFHSQIGASNRQKLVATKKLLQEPGGMPRCTTEDLRYSITNCLLNCVRAVPEALDRYKDDPEAQAQFPAVNAYHSVLQEVLSIISQDHQVLVTLDDFDEAFDEHYEVVQPLLIGLVNAIRQLRGDLGERYKYFSIKCFIPYDCLGPREYDEYDEEASDGQAKEFRHFDKLKQSTITWDYESLSVLVAKRAHPALRSVGGVPKKSPGKENAGEVLKHLFETPLSGEFPYSTAIEWIAHATLERPRDTLESVEKLRQLAIEQDPDAERIDTSHLLKHMPEISSNVARMVIREYSLKFPGIREVISQFKECGADISQKEVIARVRQAAVGQNLTPDQWVIALYETGFLCRIFMKVMGGRGQYSHERVVVSWKEDRVGKVEADRFVVHQAFWPMLNIQPPRWAFRYA